MEKKEFSVYEAPVVEIVELEAQGVICGSVNDDTEENDDWWKS